ncbi:hypothetical protein L596_024586 [Steinernema carpocapsae]|uniref:Uncharacterized protein n=1 Tax=Steinernema carpocapsae TaxID=34508 RepID=A0A4U5MH52_STECR|nr:hypothetical protein L596_024586 [Steinernema carpocapsae]
MFRRLDEVRKSLFENHPDYCRRNRRLNCRTDQKWMWQAKWSRLGKIKVKDQPNNDVNEDQFLVELVDIGDNYNWNDWSFGAAEDANLWCYYNVSSEPCKDKHPNQNFELKLMCIDFIYPARAHCETTNQYKNDHHNNGTHGNNAREDDY